MIGQKISHYKILEKIGEGGMGIVYKAEDTKLKRTVALKFLTPLLTGMEAKDRFIAEARAAASINHPNIVTVHEINEYNNQVYIAMEYVRGENLKEKIASGPLKIDEALRISRKVAKGLKAAHEKDIIHRDIKSANIMIDEKGQVKIMDFGLAKLKDQTKFTKTGVVMGTTAYMSPEQTQGSAVDHRTDIWSLGVVLYEIVTGKLPFRGEYDQAIIYAIMNEEPEPPSGLRTGVPLELEQIIHKALSKAPSKRCQHTDDLIVGLKKLRKMPVSETGRAKPVRKVLIPGILLLAVFILTGYLIFKKKSAPITPVTAPEVKPSLAVVYFENNSGDESLDNWRGAFSELLTTDLSQSKYMRVLRSDEIYGIYKRLNLLESKRYSADDLKSVARDGGVNHILKGSYIKAGENFMITAMLIDAKTGETISSLSVKAEGEKEIFAKVDELTKEIKSQLNISSSQIADDADEEIGRITTPSSEALKYYIKGRKYHNSAEYDKSIKLMEKALSIDPQFAMAYRSMAHSYGNQGLAAKRSEYLSRAMQCRGRLSDKEHFIITGDFYVDSEGKLDKAIAAYKKALELYPGDNFAIEKLGAVYCRLGEWDKAIGYFEECRKNKYRSVYALLNSTEAYRAKKLYHRAEEVIKEYLDNYDDSLLAHCDLYNTYLAQRKFDLARTQIDKMFSIDPTHLFIPWGKGDLYYYEDELKAAQKESIKLRDHGGLRAKFLGLVMMAQLNLVQGKIKKSRELTLQQIDVSKQIPDTYLQAFSQRTYAYLLFKSGDFKQALEQFSRVRDLAGQVKNAAFSRRFKKDALLGKGLTYLELDAAEQALQVVKKLKVLTEKGLDKRNIASYYYLMGMIELKQKKFDRAAGNLVKAIGIMGERGPEFIPADAPVMVVDYLAAAYLSNGHLEKARESYEHILSMTFARIEHGDIYARAFYQLGKIYQQKDWKGKAIESYNKFIGLWKECDPQFRPLVEDAKHQVEELEGKNRFRSLMIKKQFMLKVTFIALIFPGFLFAGESKEVINTKLFGKK